MRSKYTYEFINNLIDNYRNGEFSLKNISEFAGCKSKISVIHKKCGRCLDNVTLSNLVYLDRGCKYCDSHAIDSKKIKDLIESEKGYELRNTPEKVHDYGKIYHTGCQKTFKMRISDFLYNKYRCPYCFKKEPYTKESLAEKIKDITNNEYTLKNVFEDRSLKPSRYKITVYHSKCGTETTLITHNFINNNQRCKKCSKNILKYIDSSEKAKIIEEYLVKNKILFEKEKRFPDLKYKSYLRIDFYINDYKNKKIAIEFDGKQHFVTNKNNKIFTPENVILQQTRDNIKTEYCKNNDIELIRFNYLQSSEEIKEKLSEIFKC